MMHSVSVQNLVVNFICENNKVVFNRKVGNFSQNLLAVHSTCWVVWVDNNNGAGLFRNL